MATTREIRNAIVEDWCNNQSRQSFASCYAEDAAQTALSIRLAASSYDEAVSVSERTEIALIIAELDDKFNLLTDAIVELLLGRW